MCSWFSSSWTVTTEGKSTGPWQVSLVLGVVVVLLPVDVVDPPPPAVSSGRFRADREPHPAAIATRQATPRRDRGDTEEVMPTDYQST